MRYEHRVRPPGRWLIFAAALLAIGLEGLAWGGTGFTFKVPDGWTDLSPGAPAANFQGVAPKVLAEAHSGKYVAYAMDLAHADDGFAENFNAIVDPGSEPITEQLLDAVATGMSAELGRTAGGSAEVRERGLVTVAGVRAGRLVADIHLGAIHTRAMMYILPGKDEHAVVTYSAAPETFDQYRPVFEAAAQATGGVVEPQTYWGKLFSGALSGGMRGALLGACAGLVVALVVVLRRKKKPA